MVIGISDIIEDAPKKFAICIFNRASYGRCKSLIDHIGQVQNMELTVLMSSALLMEEYGKAADYIKKEGRVKYEAIEINYTETHFGSVLACAEIAAKFGRYFSSHNFDCVILVADRFETLGAAIAASYQNIPIVHLQGGEVSGNIDEKVRHAVTKLSDYHFVSTECSKKYVVAMGEDFHRIFLTGCPSLDLVNQYKIARRYKKMNYIIAQFHPVTTEGDMKDQTQILLEAVVEYCLRERVTCYWYWPNPDPSRMDVVHMLEEYHQKYPCLKKAVNKPPHEFLYDLAGARFIIGNSSCGIREASFLGVPAINVGDRQSIRERSWNVLDSECDLEKIKQAMNEQGKVKKYKRSYLFGDGKAGLAMVRVLNKLSFSTKGPLTYPNNYKYKEKHFGEARFGNHGRFFKTEAGERVALRSQSVSPGPSNEGNPT